MNGYRKGILQKLCIFGQRIDMTKHEIVLMSITGEDKPEGNLIAH